MNTCLRAALILLLASCVWSCGQYVAYDGEAPSGGGPVQQVDFPEVTTLNHALFSGVMAQHVSATSDGAFVVVDYVAWSNNKESMFLLDQYLGVLAAIDPATLESEAQRQVYWYNAYNASVIKGVLSNFKQSPDYNVIEDAGFFERPNFTFAGTQMSLNHIEQGILRGDFGNDSVKDAPADLLAKFKDWHAQTWTSDGVDARLHAALNCGALSCPNLLSSSPFVWQVDTLDSELDRMTTAWLDNADKGAGPQGVSTLFTWYKQDFLDAEGSVEAFIAKYRTGGTTGVDLGTTLEYDWTLNAPQNSPGAAQ